MSTPEQIGGQPTPSLREDATPVLSTPLATTQPLTRIQRAVLGVLAASYPDPVSIEDLRRMLEMQTAPREALLQLGDLGLARKVWKDNDTTWRASRAGVTVCRADAQK